MSTFQLEERWTCAKCRTRLKTGELAKRDESGRTICNWHPAQTEHNTGFPAKYGTICPSCHEYIEVGTLVRFNEDDDVVHFHHRGGQQVPEKAPCPRCSLVHALAQMECE